MGLCETLLPFLLNPLTYLGIGGLGLAGAAAYSYSSYAFLPSMMVLSRITSPFNFAFNLISKALDHGALKIVAAYTTFSGTINTLVQNGLTVELLFLAGQEFVNKASMSIKNIIEGLGFFTQWISTYSKGVCSLSANTDLLLNAGLSVWTGIAAYIFIIWMWDKSWYSWRNERMEQQQILLIILAVSSLSLAAYGFDILTQGVSNTESLLDTLANLGGNTLGNESVNSTK
jgi:predicted membrane protein